MVIELDGCYLVETGDKWIVMRTKTKTKKEEAL